MLSYSYVQIAPNFSVHQLLLLWELEYPWYFDSNDDIHLWMDFSCILKNNLGPDYWKVLNIYRKHVSFLLLEINRYYDWCKKAFSIHEYNPIRYVTFPCGVYVSFNGYKNSFDWWCCLCKSCRNKLLLYHILL